MFECLLSVRGLWQSSLCGLFHLILNQRTAAGQVLWEEVLRWGCAGRKLGTDTWGEVRKSRPGQMEKPGCSTVLQALAGRSEAGRPCRAVLQYREWAGVSCIDPLLEEVYPLSEGSVTWDDTALCSWGLCLESCHCEMTLSTASIIQMIQTLSTKLSKSKYSINVSSYHHQYHPPDSPYPSSCQNEYIALLTEEPMSSFSERFPQPMTS